MPKKDGVSIPAGLRNFERNYDLFRMVVQKDMNGDKDIMSAHTLPEKLDRKIIYESDWVSLYLDKVRMPDGRIFNTYHKLHYPHESVSVVIVNEKNEIW